MSKIVTIQSQQMWEYCHLIRRTEDAILAEMNQFGEQGWELVSMDYYKDIKGAMNWIAFMKRPSTGLAPKATGPATASPVVVHPTDKPKPAAGGTPGGGADDAVFDFKTE